MVKNDCGQNLTYQCDSCSRRHPKWQGKCDGCNEWNTIVEKMDSLGWSDRNISIEFNNRKLQAFDVGASAAKLQYVLK